jgi:two-component system, OmpR family, sensor histidine kinase VicK
LYGVDNVVNAELEFFYGTKDRIDSCMNFTRPQLAIELEPIRNAFIDAKSRGVRLRYLTEITKDNISYCKELIPLVDELRHLDGIKGNFMLSQSEYLAPVILFETGEISSEIIYSKIKELVEQQQYIFDTFWTRAIPAEQKLRELESARSTYYETQTETKTKLLEDQDQISKSIKQLIDNSDELLVCSDFDGMQMIYNNNNFFDSYKIVLNKNKKGEHKGIRWIGNLHKKEEVDRFELIEIFLNLGVQIRHVKNILPINFAIGGQENKKEVHAIIEYTDGGSLVKTLLVSNDPDYVKHFSLIFEELWKNSLIL